MENTLEGFREIGRKARKIIQKTPPDEAKKIIGTNPLGQNSLKIDVLVEDKAVIPILGKYNFAGILVTEERGELRTGGSEDRVICDPVDGSKNLSRMVPDYCIGLAYSSTRFSKDIECSYVMNLVTGDEYYAIKGKGAFLNGKKLLLSNETNLSKCRFAIDYNNCLDRFDEVISLIVSLKDIRRVGADLLDICYVASGALEGFIVAPDQLSIIHIPGAKIVEEAGGIVHYLRGEENMELNLKNKLNAYCFANKDVYRQAMPLLKGVRL